MNTAQYKTWDEFMEGVWRQNPVFVMVLGMCPTLAVTVSAINAISMGVATLFVLVCSCGLVSLMRKLTPKEVRIAVYIVIIATFVTAVDYAIQAISLALYDALGAFIQRVVSVSGKKDEAHVGVVRGVKLGDRVVASPPPNLENGAYVEL